MITVLPPRAADLEEFGLLDWTVSQLVQDVMPFRVVQGSAELILARTTTGWRVTLINNLGITKECHYTPFPSGCTADQLDPRQRQTVELAWDHARYGALRSAQELITRIAVPIATGGSLTVEVPAGEVRVLNLVLAPESEKPITADDDLAAAAMAGVVVDVSQGGLKRSPLEEGPLWV